MITSTPVLVVCLACGLGFLVFVSMAILDLFENYKLSAKGK